MTSLHMAITAFFFFAGAFALASLNHDLRAAWAAFKRLSKELNDDDA